MDLILLEERNQLILKNKEYIDKQCFINTNLEKYINEFQTKINSIKGNNYKSMCLDEIQLLNEITGNSKIINEIVEYLLRHNAIKECYTFTLIKDLRIVLEMEEKISEKILSDKKDLDIINLNLMKNNEYIKQIDISLWLLNPTIFEMGYSHILKLLEENGLLLRYIPIENQTKEMCKIAVNQNGLALEWAKYKNDPEIYINAVKENGFCIKFVI